MEDPNKKSAVKAGEGRAGATKVTPKKSAAKAEADAEAEADAVKAGAGACAGAITFIAGTVPETEVAGRHHLRGVCRYPEDFACAIPGCRGAECKCLFGHPNLEDAGDKGRFFCQHGNVCWFEKTGECFNSHGYWWTTEESPSLFVCQRWAMESQECGHSNAVCVMNHSEQEPEELPRVPKKYGIHFNPVVALRDLKTVDTPRAYDPKMILCARMYHRKILCPAYARRACKYGHSPKTSLLCPHAKNCAWVECPRIHSVPWDVRRPPPPEMHCPWQTHSPSGVCHYRRRSDTFCPFFHRPLPVPEPVLNRVARISILFAPRKTSPERSLGFEERQALPYVDRDAGEENFEHESDDDDEEMVRQVVNEMQAMDEMQAKKATMANKRKSKRKSQDVRYQ